MHLLFAGVAQSRGSESKPTEFQTDKQKHFRGGAGNFGRIAEVWAPEMDEQEQPTIRITLDDSVAQGEYINFANIIHSPSEFVIDLGRIVPGRTDVKVYSRAIMTPLHAKQLLEALAHNISMFEQKFGEIRVDGTTPFSSNEPSN